jgi:hypothetical protein
MTAKDGMKLEQNQFMHDKDTVYIVQADNPQLISKVDKTTEKPE